MRLLDTGYIRVSENLGYLIGAHIVRVSIFGSIVQSSSPPISGNCSIVNNRVSLLF